jgi:flagellar hook-length control protein FliK
LATAPAESDAAKALERVEITSNESIDAASNEPDSANAAPTGPRTPDAGRSPTHAPALSRLPADRSLHAPTESGADAGELDRGRFVGRVEGAIRAAQNRDGRVQVRLSPPELGALRIELTIQQGALSARLEAETTAARNMLLDNLPALRERLAQQDIRVERFDVDLRQDAHSGGGSSHQGAMQERQSHEADWRQNQSRADRARTGTTAPQPTLRGLNPGVATDSGLDVRV